MWYWFLIYDKIEVTHAFLIKKKNFFWFTFIRELISDQVYVYALLSDFEIIWGQTFAMMDDSGCCHYE